MRGDGEDMRITQFGYTNHEYVALAISNNIYAPDASHKTMIGFQVHHFLLFFGKTDVFSRCAPRPPCQSAHLCYTVVWRTAARAAADFALLGAGRMFTILCAVLAGICVTLQNSLNALMNPFIGAMGTSAAVFVIQLVLLLAYQACVVRRRIRLRDVPPGYYSSGLIAVVVIGMIGYCVSQMGSAVTTCCSVAGQIIMSALVDHFGLFGSARHRFTARRVAGFALILAGVLVLNLAGGASAGRTPLQLLLLAVLLGCGAVVVRTLNFKATQATGSTIGGGIVNSLSGAFFGLLLYFIVHGFRPDLSAFTAFSPAYYTAGLFGGACLLLNIAAYARQNVFYATIFMLIGQVATGIAMDLLVFHALSAGKCLGMAIILTGVLLDKLLTRARSA